MRPAFRLILALAIAVVATAGTRAQEASGTNVFTFAPAPAPGDLNEIPRADINKKLDARASLNLRPNTSTELYLWVLNPTADKDEYTVEMKTKNGALVSRAKLTIPGNTWARVRLPKPAPPAVSATPPVAAPAAPAGAAPPVAPELPPPGTALPISGGESRLVFRLLDKAGEPMKDGAGKVYVKDFPVSILAPTDYVETPVTRVTPGKGNLGVTMTVTQKPFPYPGTASVQLLFPPQPAMKDSFIRDGIYRRTFAFDTKNAEFNKENPAPTVSLGGEIENAGDKLRVYVGVDGIDRAFAYTLNPLGKTPDTQVIPERLPAVRISRVAVSAVTQPVGRYPVLVEVDNPGADDSLELRVRPLGKGADLTETVKLDSIRDVHIWLDPAGPKDGGLLFTTRSRDWVKPLDLSSVRGKVEVFGVLRTPAGEVPSDQSLLLTVDATPPERITFLPIDPKLVKGKPLSLAATVNDPDTDVTKATFFLCKQLDDGKIPADAVKAVGTQALKNPKVWEADLKVPDDFRGVGLVGVVFTNQVGLVNDPPLVQRVEIVDAKPPTGKIEGKVVFGENPQPGVFISLRDADGKEKSATKSLEKGVFKFEGIPVGSYRLVALKKDSSTGAAATTTVVVDADKPAKPTLTLEKIRQ